MKLRHSAALTFALFVLSAGLPLPAAADAGLPGATLSFWWALPFAGMLLSIALFPLLAPQVWHHHFGKIAAVWSLLVIGPMAALFGVPVAASQLAHTALLEYLPFLILILALFTVAGGICVRGNLHGTPQLNTGLLALGTLLASVMGTTGASMLLIRPLIRANDNRRHQVHVIVFFIFLVGNIGGCLTPLGDPPLFLGFLKGVDFWWTARHLTLPLVVNAGILLALFFALDWYYFHHREQDLAEERPSYLDPTPDSPLRVDGKFNLLLLAGIVGTVLMSGIWRPGIEFRVLGSTVELQNLVRDVLLLGITALSLVMTTRETRTDNGFSWGPILEVGKLFAGIFITIIPVIAILQAGREGAMAPLVSLVSEADGRPDNIMYFWLSGILSSFLDNAPTYLVFFNLAGGDPATLMGPLAATLTAISCGAVFMGANSYIGNAPNFMIKAIAEERGIRMPSFFGYMVWSCAFLLPLFALTTWIFFR